MEPKRLSFCNEGLEVFPFSKYEELFGNLNDKAFTFLPPKAEDAREELAKVKDHLSKLHFNYLELETKKEFLETVCTNVLRTEDEIDLAGVRAHTKTLKAENEQMVAELSIIVDDLCAAYKEYDDKENALTGVYDDAVGTVKAFKEEESKAFAETNRADSQAQLDELEDEERKLLGELAREERALAKITEKENTLEHVPSFLQTLAAEIKVLEALVAEQEAELAPNESSPVCSAEMKSWYVHVRAILESLGGVSLVDVATDALHLRMIVEEEALTIVVTMNPGTATIAEIAIEASNGLHVDDVVQHAVDKQDLAFFLREARQRVVCRQSLQHELDVLRANPSLTIEVAADSCFAYHVCLETGISAQISLSPDYPFDGTVPTVVWVEQHKRVSEELQALLTGSLSSPAPAADGISLTDVINLLEALHT